jgi:hypothetical protein
MAKRKKSSSRAGPTDAKRKKRRSTQLPRTAAQYRGKPEAFQDRWDRIVGVISQMRSRRTSLKRAAKEAGLDPETVVRWAGSALQKGSNGRYAAKRSDQLLRILKIPDSHGMREVAIRGSRQASLLGKYWSALERFLQTGDASRLEKFRGKSIKDADGVLIPLPTDRAELNRLASTANISFESLYARSI